MTCELHIKYLARTQNFWRCEKGNGRSWREERTTVDKRLGEEKGFRRTTPCRDDSGGPLEIDL